MDQTCVTPLASWAAFISASFAAVALVFNYVGTRIAREKHQLEVFDRAYTGIVQLEEKLHAATASNSGENFFPGWRGMFINRLEYFSFLINHSYIQDHKVTDFFSEAIKRWYEEVFEKFADENERSDPKIYPELKALYLKLRSLS